MMVLDKKSTRKMLKDRLKDLTDRMVYENSALVCEAVVGLDVFKQAKSVMMFLSLPNEIETSPLMLAAFKAGKTVTVPKCDWDNHTMKPVVIETLNCKVDYGPFGVRNVVCDNAVAIAEVDLMIVPGLGFDNQGQRLGRGAGFYDRFMSEPVLSATKCGVGFGFQMIDQIPVDAHDVKLDMLVTDEKVYQF